MSGTTIALILLLLGVGMYFTDEAKKDRTLRASRDDTIKQLQEHINTLYELLDNALEASCKKYSISWRKNATAGTLKEPNENLETV